MGPAKFATSEIVNLIFCRVPRSDSPQFRLQNFLLGNEDWVTSNKCSLRIGEQGELKTLNFLLGEKAIKICRILDDWSVQMKDENESLFPTDAHFQTFVKNIEKELGEEITLTFT